MLRSSGSSRNSDSGGFIIQTPDSSSASSGSLTLSTGITEMGEGSIGGEVSLHSGWGGSLVLSADTVLKAVASRVDLQSMTKAEK